MVLERLNLLPVIACVLICGCGGRPTGEYVIASATEALMPAASQSTDGSSIPEIKEIKSSRHIIREGELRFETESRDQTRKSIRGFVDAHRGYLSEDREVRSSQAVEQVMVLRVPADEFEGLLEDVSKGVRWFDVRRIQAIDISEEFVDIEARLKTRKETEERYRELLKMANSVEDVLKIESQIDKLRAEIESTEGRFRLLQDRENYSTLQVSFYESLAMSNGFWTRLSRNLATGWTSVVEVVIAASVLWPFGVLAAGIAVVVRWRGRMTMARKVAA